MRHLENPQLSSSEYFKDIENVKEVPNLILDDSFIKNELITTNINLELNNETDSSDEFNLTSNNEVKKNRRKAFAPQRAVQQEFVQNGSFENSSESSQDISDRLRTCIGEDFKTNAISSIISCDNLVDPNEEDLFDEINNDIFKQFQQADEMYKLLTSELSPEGNTSEGVEKIDEKIIDNVKEEWKAHWGIKCNMCEQVFPFKLEFDKHYLLSYNQPPIYTCTFCNKTAEKYSTFRSHCYRHITEGRYKCHECSKGFSLQSMLHVHVLSKHTKARPFICEECGKSFVTKPGLKIHLKKHKTEVKEDYPCAQCGKILHTRGGLTSHMNVHRLGRRFMCDVCGKTFTQKVNMQQHVKQHTGDKPHACDKCGKTFAERSHLARHYSFHSEARPYKCKVCEKMYKTERCLKLHSLVHAEARPFVCDYCHKGFLSSTKLKQHYNIHTGERPYKCKYCERSFTNYPNWLKHTRRRHKVDHKTGEGLQSTKLPKEAPATSITSEQHVPPTTDNPTDPLLSDFLLSKTEEIFFQQGLVNCPLLDDKIILQQSVDLGSTNNSVGLIVPYFQTALTTPQTIIPHNASTTLPIQISEMLYTPYIQQTLPCE